jgi:hypothetical protein
MNGRKSRTSFFRQLFIKPPSEDELAVRNEADSREIVKMIGTGNYLLQIGSYVTEQDMEKAREELLGAS